MLRELSTRRTVLGLVSIALHVGLLAVPQLLPTPVRVETLDPGELIEVVQWSGSGESTARARAPASGSPSSPAVPEPEVTRPSTPTPAPQAEPPITERPKSGHARQPSSTPAPALPAEPNPTPSPSLPSEPATSGTSEVPSPHGLALQGLRERSSARAQLPSPRLGPGIAPPRPSEHTVPLPPADVPSGPPGDDAVPRTLADAGFARNKKGDYVYQEPAGHFTATLSADGRVHFKDHLVTASKQTGYAPKMAGLSEIVRKAQRRELWSHDKAKLARRTFDLRLAIAVTFAETQINHRLKVLYRDLLEIWSATELAAEKRRLTLFERWDECEERMRVKLPGFEDATDTRIDTLRKGAGERARETITAFVRRQLPAGTADAYGDDELDRLNRSRRSKARFSPYDAPAGDDAH
jgi:hypothetical protein